VSKSFLYNFERGGKRGKREEGAIIPEDITRRRGGAEDAGGEGAIAPEDFTQRRGGAEDAEGEGKARKSKGSGEWGVGSKKTSRRGSGGRGNN
jgi:hypothetical protein